MSSAVFKQLGQKHFGYELYLCGEHEDGEAKVAVCNNSRVRKWALEWVRDYALEHHKEHPACMCALLES